MVDYSSWKTIELSSDEDEVHPFIENGTLFRLRHEARLKKMEDRRKEEFALECHRASYMERLEKLKNAIKENEENGIDCIHLQSQMKELEAEEKQLKEKEDKLKKQVVAWYIDTICHPGFSKMFINTSTTEKESTPEKFSDYVLQNKSDLKHFALIQSFEESKHFLLSHPHVIQKHALYYLVSYGIKMYIKGEKNKLKNIARQIICLQHILELYKMYNKNTEDILHSFFLSVKMADVGCKVDFKKETYKVQKLIKNLVKNKMNEIENYEENDDNVTKDNDDNVTNDDKCYKLDAEEVFLTLPQEMQYCFIIKDKNALANILANLPSEEAEYHMKRCVSSGLWIPEDKD